MIRKIILENYMSHIRTVIEPAAGLTVLIGPNNCGKSAIAHALEMICYNSDAASYAIRHGAKKAIVTIETTDDDGTPHSLVWERKKETVKYIIDGREISGMGRGKIPDDLHQFLRMPEIPAATGESFRIHFGLQKSPIFLLDGPAKEIRAAQFFASSSDADRLMDMQRRHKTREANAKRDKDRLDGEIAKLDQQLGDLAPLDEIAQRMVQLEADHRQIIDQQNQITLLAKAIAAIERATLAERLYFARSQSLRGLGPLPKVHSLQPLASLVQSIQQVKHQAAVNQARIQASSNLKAAPVIAVTSGLARLVQDIQLVTTQLSRATEQLRITKSLQGLPSLGDVRQLRQTVQQIGRLAREAEAQHDRARLLSKAGQPPKVADVAALAKAIQTLSRAQEATAKLRIKHLRLAGLPVPPTPREIGPLTDALGQLQRHIASVEQARKALDRSQQDVAELAKQIEIWVQQNPRCQSCGQSITPELVMTGGHAHD
jgi:exonuclease SbcC